MTDKSSTSSSSAPPRKVAQSKKKVPKKSEQPASVDRVEQDEYDEKHGDPVSEAQKTPFWEIFSPGFRGGEASKVSDEEVAVAMALGDQAPLSGAVGDLPPVVLAMFKQQQALMAKLVQDQQQAMASMQDAAKEMREVKTQPRQPVIPDVPNWSTTSRSVHNFHAVDLALSGQFV